jgi:hypothetical protein
VSCRVSALNVATAACSVLCLCGSVEMTPICHRGEACAVRHCRTGREGIYGRIDVQELAFFRPLNNLPILVDIGALSQLQSLLAVRRHTKCCAVIWIAFRHLERNPKHVRIV